MESDALILDPLLIQKLTRDQVANYVRGRLDAVRIEIRNRPHPGTALLESGAWQRWINRLLIQYGRALEVVQFCQMVGYISAEEFQCYKTELLNAVSLRSVDAQIEGI